MSKNDVTEKELYGGEKIQVRTYEDPVHLKDPLDVTRELEKYEKALKEKKICHVQFSGIDRKGILYSYHANGIRVAMPAKNIDGFDHDPTKKELLSPYLCHPCDVVVTKVDKKNQIVTVSMKDAMPLVNNGENPRGELINAIEKGLETGIYVQVPARIMSISGKRTETDERDYTVAILNIGGYGIGGYVHRKDWSPCFTKTLKGVANPGEIINVVVTGKKNWEGPIYECNRAATFDTDPWEGIEEKFQKNSTVRVKCIQREEKGFFATIEGIPEINVYCYYPDESTGIHIEIGKEYIGRVVKVKEKEKVMQIRILMSVEES